MNANKKTRSITRCIYGMKIIFAMAVVLILAFFVVGEFVLPDERDPLSQNCKLYEGDWYHIQENGERVKVQVPGTVDTERGKTVSLVTILPEDLQRNDVICFRPIWQDVDIYIDKELRSSYNTENSRPFGTNSAFRYVFVELNDEDAGKELTFCFCSDSKYAGTTRNVYIGDKASVWVTLVQENAFKMVVATLLMGLSLISIITCIVMAGIYKKSLALNYLAWTLFFCSLWMLSEIEFRQLLFRNVSVVTSLTYWSLMIIPFPFIIYIDDVQKGRYRSAFIIPLVYSTIVLIVGTLLQVFDVVQFVTQLPFIHGGIAFSMIFIISTITIDAVKKQLSDYFFVALGIYGMLFFAILEMVLYYIDSVYTLGSMLMVGMLFLLIMAVIKTGQDLFHSEQSRQHAVMASKAQAQFLASMSHEIRTPINAVIGMNEMILRENHDETIQEYAHNIQSSSAMLLGLVNDVLDFSKIESGQLELVEENYHLAALIHDEMVLLNARAAGKSISTHMEIAKDLPSVLYGDQLRIKQVITNLISNAVKYTQEGNVVLHVSCKWIDDTQVHIIFQVRDTGSGIRPEDVEKVFNSFKRLELDKNRHIEGTGLGLNIAKGLVEQMQGNILVDSKYGKGSTFTVYIPQKVMDKTYIDNVDESVNRLRREKEQAGKQFVAPEAQVLVVDDNKMNLVVIGALLKRTNMQVDYADSGEKCLEMTKTKKYDIILMDHMMPNMDGIETLHKLRKEEDNPNQNQIVIALTANAIAGCREMYLEKGFDDYCSKPVKAEVLDELLIAHLPKERVKFL